MEVNGIGLHLQSGKLLHFGFAADGAGKGFLAVFSIVRRGRDDSRVPGMGGFVLRIAMPGNRAGMPMVVFIRGPRFLELVGWDIAAACSRFRLC